MKRTVIYLSLIFGIILAISCKENEARKPISQSKGVFLKESVVRNKKLNNAEEKYIDSIINSSPDKKYFTSNHAFWYTYDVRNEIDTLSPKTGDIAYFEYDVNDLKGNVIYTALELRPQMYRVEKQNIMIGLKEGIKLMRKGETVTFIFPSNMAYGYHGDKNRIGSNIPLICKVTLTDFEKDPNYNKNTSNN